MEKNKKKKEAKLTFFFLLEINLKFRFFITQTQKYKVICGHGKRTYWDCIKLQGI